MANWPFIGPPNMDGDIWNRTYDYLCANRPCIVLQIETPIPIRPRVHHCQDSAFDEKETTLTHYFLSGNTQNGERDGDAFF